MVLLYQESDEEISVVAIDQVTTITTESNSELEQKVLILNSTIRNKDAELAELKKELAAIKVTDHDLLLCQMIMYLPFTGINY